MWFRDSPVTYEKFISPSGTRVLAHSYSTTGRQRLKG